MTDSDGGAPYPKNGDDIDDELRREFLDDSLDVLRALDGAVEEARHGRIPLVQLMSDVRRAANMIMGQAPNFGLRLMGTVAHRFNEFTANVRDIMPPRGWDDLLKFIGVLINLAEGSIPSTAAPSELVRGLPSKLGFDLNDIQVRNIEVMLVMPHGAQTRYVERELQQCGYRVSVVFDTFQALPLIVQTKPDLVIISAVMPEFDGLELAIGLTAMPATRNVPLALITSLPTDDEGLRLLPGRVPVIHKSASFSDDLFKALDDLFLI